MVISYNLQLEFMNYKNVGNVLKYKFAKKICTQIQYSSMIFNYIETQLYFQEYQYVQQQV